MKNNNYHFTTTILSLFIMLIVSTSMKCQTNNAQASNDTNTINVSWFKVKQISERVWRIDDNGGDNMYLVEGDEKALLIDTGTGVADLAGCVESITKLPLIFVNTHGHPDQVVS